MSARAHCLTPIAAISAGCCVFRSSKASRSESHTAAGMVGEARSDQITTGWVSASTRPPSSTHFLAMVGLTTPTWAQPACTCWATDSW